MVDAKLVEEIVQAVLAALMQDPRFVAATKGGYFSASPALSQNQQADSGLRLNKQNNPSLNPGTPWFNRPSGGSQSGGLQSGGSQPNGSSGSQVSAAPSSQSGNRSGSKFFGRVLSEWDILTTHRSGGRAITIGRSVIVTPLAKDRARDLSVALIVEQ
jgi:hypothetical protein